MDDLYGMILAGGSGTRLWPISRENTPKQLLSLSGSGRSLLQDAFGRLARAVPPEKIVTVTGAAYGEQVFGHLRQVAPDYPRENLLVEAEGRDSAPAVLWGTLRLAARDPEAVVALVWSDQLIVREDAFQQALARGAEAVRDGGIAVIGVPANRPATNLGYIHTGPEVADGVFAAERFIEKPDAATAEKLVAEGGYLWNPGVFVFKAATLLAEFERLAPEMVRAFHRHGGDGRQGDWTDPERVAAAYAEIEKVSIDYLVLEKTDKLLLVPAELGWSDLGTWDELYLQAEKDEQGNALQGNVVALHTGNTLVRGGRRLIATVGVEHLVVVDTDDALLICDLRRVQDIKALVSQLKAHGLAQVEGFGENVRPWGSYAVLAEAPGYKVKVLEVKPGQKLSLQLHQQRAEHWVVVEGTVWLTRDEEVREFNPGEYLFIPQGAKHRIDNRGRDTVRIIEVQQGGYLGEDDIVRFEDVYGRS